MDSIRCSLKGKNEDQEAQAYIRSFTRRQWCGTWCSMLSHNIFACARDTREGLRQPRFGTAARLGPRPARSEASHRVGGAVNSPVVVFPDRIKAEEPASCKRVPNLEGASSGRTVIRHGVNEREIFPTTDPPTDLAVFTQTCSGALLVEDDDSGRHLPAEINTLSEGGKTVQTGPTESALMNISTGRSPNPKSFAVFPRNNCPTERDVTRQWPALFTALSGASSKASSGRNILKFGPLVARGEGMGSSPSADKFPREPSSRIDGEQEELDAMGPNDGDAGGNQKEAIDSPRIPWRSEKNPTVKSVPGRQRTVLRGLADESNLPPFDLSRYCIENGGSVGEFEPLDSVVPHEVTTQDTQNQARRGLTQLQNAAARDSRQDDSVVTEKVEGEGVQNCSTSDTSQSEESNGDHDEGFVVKSGNDTHVRGHKCQPKGMGDSLALSDPPRHRVNVIPEKKMTLSVESVSPGNSSDGTNDANTELCNNLSGSVVPACHGTSSHSSVEERGRDWGLSANTTPATTTVPDRYANYTFAAMPPDDSAGSDGSQHFGWQ